MRKEIDNFVRQHSLTNREKDILQAMTMRVTSIKDIAKNLESSPSTVANQLTKIFEKTKTSSKSELLSLFLQDVVKSYNNCKLFTKKPKILIIDDEEDICEMLVDTLTARGLVVYSLSDPLKACEYISELDLDFISLDFRMPKINGLELLKKIRKIYKYHPKAIFITANPDLKDDEIFHYGAIAKFTKPIDSKKLFNVIIENFIEDIYEKNRFLRIDSNIEAISNNDVPLTIKNIGFGGAFIPLDMNAKNKEKFKLLQKFSLSFRLDSNQEQINALCEVVWNRHKGTPDLESGIGVKFINLTEDNKRFLEDYVRTHKIVSFIPMGATTPQVQKQTSKTNLDNPKSI